MDDSEKQRPMELPILMPGQLQSMNFGREDHSPDYLSYRPRSAHERGLYNTGISYLVGLIGGGTYGAIKGLFNSPSNRFKIRVNTVLNQCSKKGPMLGNTLGTIALMYSITEWGVEKWELDRRFNSDAVPSIVAATATGAIYKSAGGPRVAILAAAMAGTAMGVSTVASSYIPNGYGVRHMKSFFF